MNKQEQEQFVRELTGNVLAEVLAKSVQWPDDWDGHELRQLLADAFAASSCMSDAMKDKRAARRRAYENTVLVENL